MNVLATRIKQRREELGYSQEELAKKLGYKSRSSINKIEMGETDIPQSKIKIFANILETTPAFLMGWDEVNMSLDAISTVVGKYKFEIAETLKKICINCNINIAKLEQSNYIECSENIITQISETIDYELYNKLFLQYYKKFENTKDSILIKKLKMELKSIDIYNLIADLVQTAFHNTITDIYAYVNNIEKPKFELTSNSINAYFNYIDKMESSMSQNVIESIETSEAVYDIAEDITKIIENELFYDALKDILTYDMNQLTEQGQEMALEYIKYLLNNDIYKETN